MNIRTLLPDSLLSRNLKIAGTLVISLMVAGCQSTYYSAMEKAGIHKRDIMVDRIEDTQSAQEQAQEQFQSALEQFQREKCLRGFVR